MNLVSVNICGIHSSLEEALLDLLCKYWFMWSVWNFCRWVSDLPPCKTSPAVRSVEKQLFSQAIGFLLITWSSGDPLKKREKKKQQFWGTLFQVFRYWWSSAEWRGEGRAEWERRKCLKMLSGIHSFDELFPVPWSSPFITLFSSLHHVPTLWTPGTNYLKHRQQFISGVQDFGMNSVLDRYWVISKKEGKLLFSFSFCV